MQTLWWLNVAFRLSIGKGVFNIGIQIIKWSFSPTVMKILFLIFSLTKLSHKDAPWMTSEIKQKLKEKTRIYRKYVNNRMILVTSNSTNSFLVNTNMPTIPPLFDSGKIVTDYPSKAEIFNNYFATQCTPLKTKMRCLTWQLRTPLSLSSLTFSQANIIDIIRGIDPNKASG